MPIYEFASDTGERIERFYPMALAPRLGYTLHVDGKAFRRILSGGRQLQANPAGDYHFAARTVDRYHPDAPRTDENGVAQFSSKQEVLEFLQRHNTRYPDRPLHWNQ